MGSDNMCNNIGIGPVKIKMFNGAIRTLYDVSHVPRLKRNLIFLSMLDSMGYSLNSKMVV